MDSFKLKVKIYPTKSEIPENLKLKLRNTLLRIYLNVT